jgi:hypothetical protein
MRIFILFGGHGDFFFCHILPPPRTPIKLGGVPLKVVRNLVGETLPRAWLVGRVAPGKAQTNRGPPPGTFDFGPESGEAVAGGRKSPRGCQNGIIKSFHLERHGTENPYSSLADGHLQSALSNIKVPPPGPQRSRRET